MDAAWLDAVVLLLDGPALCAGVVVNPTGVVATAYHCVASGGRPTIEWRDGTRVLGTVYARDPAADLALVRVERTGLVALEVREDEPAVGERVYGLGHPFGNVQSRLLEGVLRWSVTEGIVSAVGTRVIQTDTALNPGNSGGPVVDAQGRVIGIASRKLRADNVAFLSKASALRELVYDPRPGPFLGGTWGVGLGLSVTPAARMGGSAWVAVRDRLVLRGWLLAAPQETATLDGVVALRQRVGDGTWSTAFDVGVGDGTLGVPYFDARVTVGRVGFGARLAFDGTLEAATIDLEWPGNLGVF